MQLELIVRIGPYSKGVPYFLVLIFHETDKCCSDCKYSLHYDFKDTDILS